MTQATCSCPDCDNPAKASRGWCWKHYYRWYRTGSTDDPRRSPEQRFFARIDRLPSDCWQWDSAFTHGYGKFFANGRHHLVHRWSYEHFIGPIPEGLTVDHRCHDEHAGCAGGPICPHRRCVNPQHLKLTTGPANASRSVKSWQTHCKRGHEFTEVNTYRANGRRTCITCRTARKRAWRRRQK